MVGMAGVDYVQASARLSLEDVVDDRRCWR